MKSSLPASAALSQSIWPLASLKEKLKYNLLQDPELRSVLSSSLQQEVISLYFRYTPTAFHFIPLLPYAITYIYLFTSSMPWKLVESYGSSLQPQYPEQTFVIDWKDKSNNNKNRSYMISMCRSQALSKSSFAASKPGKAAWRKLWIWNHEKLLIFLIAFSPSHIFGLWCLKSVESTLVEISSLVTDILGRDKGEKCTERYGNNSFYPNKMWKTAWSDMFLAVNCPQKR